MSVKIKAYTLENFKRVKEIHFEPEESGLFVIGGKNREGKTSSLDGISWLLGGAKFNPSKPKNSDTDGDLFGQIVLSNGLVVERGGKNGSLKVTDPQGKKHGQELLNSFVSALSLDIPKFMHSSDREKAMILLDTLGIKPQLDELERKEKTLYDNRTETGRIALSLRKHADEMPFYFDAPDQEISAASIIERQQKAVHINTRNDAERAELERLRERLNDYEKQLESFDAETVFLAEHNKKQMESDVKSAQAKINANTARAAELEQEIKRLKKENAEIMESAERKKTESEQKENIRISERNEKRKNAVCTIETTKTRIAEKEKEVSELPENIDLSVFKDDIEALEEQNAKFRANAAHDKAANEASKKEKEYEDYTAKIEEVRRQRMSILASVKMPLDGLSVKDSLLYYKNQRWDCMSSSEQLIVAASIVRAINPECGFVLMDQLEAMDLDTLDDFDKWLKNEELQVIATRVSSGTECSIIIENGLMKP